MLFTQLTKQPVQNDFTYASKDFVQICIKKAQNYRSKRNHLIKFY